MEAQIMKKQSKIVSFVRTLCLSICIAALWVVFPTRGAADDPLDAVLERTGKQVSSFLDLISEMNCTEHVLQEKLADNGKVVEKEESSFDYLIILSTSGGELNLVESRIVPADAKQQKKPRSPLLISNGFSTLFLVFHPYYAASFQFAREGEESLNGRILTKIHFQHIPGMRSPAALAVRGREYPLDLEGTAWIDAATGIITKLTANVDTGMEDVGLRTLHSEVRFALVTFHDSPESFWLPSQTTVEVESRHQHWRNTHRFSGYKRFSVSTKEQIAKQ
jgi:hypothetical protein